MTSKRRQRRRDSTKSKIHYVIILNEAALLTWGETNNSVEENRAPGNTPVTMRELCVERPYKSTGESWAGQGLQ